MCFFKQKTAYQIPKRDWSSDVCSSDLEIDAVPAEFAGKIEQAACGEAKQLINYTAADWTITAIGTGTSAQADVNGGAVLVTTSGASGDSRWAQKLGRSFLLSASKKAFFKARLKIDNVLTSSMLVGLQLTDTTPEDATDGIYFIKASANSIDIVCRKDATTGSNSAAGIATLVNDTFIELAWYYDGEGMLYYAVDGVVKGSISAAAAYLPDAQLSVSFGFETNAVATRAGTVDYVFAALER